MLSSRSIASSPACILRMLAFLPDRHHRKWLWYGVVTLDSQHIHYAHESMACATINSAHCIHVEYRLQPDSSVRCMFGFNINPTYSCLRTPAKIEHIIIAVSSRLFPAYPPPPRSTSRRLHQPAPPIPTATCRRRYQPLHQDLLPHKMFHPSCRGSPTVRIH